MLAVLVVQFAATLRAPIGAVHLAPRIWLVRDLLSQAVTEGLRRDVLSALHHPCPRQEHAWPRKQCTKIQMSPNLLSRLVAVWPELDLSSLSTIAASVDFPSDADDRSMRHHHHIDVFPERDASAKGPDATAVLYLSEAAHTHPASLAARTEFPRVGVAVSPKAGSLLAWTNVLDDGTADEDAEHGVGAYAGKDLPPRVALHIPMSFHAAAYNHSGDATAATAHAEHVGCSGPPYHVRRSWESLWRWRRLVKGLRHHVGHILMAKLRAVGLLSGKLIALQQRAAERVYAPGGAGFEIARIDFESLAGHEEQPPTTPQIATAPGALVAGDDADGTDSDAGEGEGAHSGASSSSAVASATAVAAAAALLERRRRKAAMIEQIERVEREAAARAAAQQGKRSPATLDERLEQFEWRRMYRMMMEDDWW